MKKSIFILLILFIDACECYQFNFINLHQEMSNQLKYFPFKNNKQLNKTCSYITALIHDLFASQSPYIQKVTRDLIRIGEKMNVAGLDKVVNDIKLLYSNLSQAAVSDEDNILIKKLMSLDIPLKNFTYKSLYTPSTNSLDIVETANKELQEKTACTFEHVTQTKFIPGATEIFGMLGAGSGTIPFMISLTIIAGASFVAHRQAEQIVDWMLNEEARVETSRILKETNAIISNTTNLEKKAAMLDTNHEKKNRRIIRQFRKPTRKELSDKQIKTIVNYVESVTNQ